MVLPVASPPPPPHLQTSISCPLPPEPPCPMPCPGPITRRALRGPGTTSHLCPYTAPQPHYEPATVSPITIFSPLASFLSLVVGFPPSCPFITINGPSEKKPSVATSLSFSFSVTDSLASSLPLTLCLCLYFLLSLSLFLAPQHEEITIVDSSSASRSCISFMRLWV